MSSMDLVAFLNARLDERERVAREATQGRWFWTDPDTSDFPQDSVRLVADQGAWKTCEYFCTWSGEENIHRGAQGKPGHEHRVTAEVVGSWGYDANGINVEDTDAAHIARHDPARVLAEVAAKRRIIELHTGDHECSTYDHNGDIDHCTWVIGDCSTLQLLGLPDADHPDYRQEWAL